MDHEPRLERPTGPSPDDDPWAENERAAKQRIREDAKRLLGVNLAEGLAHSEFLLSFVGTLRKS